MHVPLIIRYPQEAFKGKRVEDLVQSTISLTLTILNLYGIDIPEVMKGKDLIEITKGEEEGYNEVYFNQGLWTAKRAIRDKRWKLIRTLHNNFWDTPDTELYTIKADPQETCNLAKDEPDIVDELELKMSRWLKEKLTKQIDPLELIVSRGMPVYDWVAIVAERTGLLESYEEWRMRIDRGEPSRAGPRTVSPPRW